MQPRLVSRLYPRYFRNIHQRRLANASPVLRTNHAPPPCGLPPYEIPEYGLASRIQKQGRSRHAQTEASTRQVRQRYSELTERKGILFSSNSIVFLNQSIQWKGLIFRSISKHMHISILILHGVRVSPPSHASKYLWLPTLISIP